MTAWWEKRHRCRPVLCETFVDPTRFDGACYRAANWAVIGSTAGRRSGSRAKPPKQILVLPFDLGFRAVLRGESKTPRRRNARWEEFDFEGVVWTIPAERMNAGREHRVPLSPRALEVLDEARRLLVGAGTVFPTCTGRT